MQSNKLKNLTLKKALSIESSSTDQNSRQMSIKLPSFTKRFSYSEKNISLSQICSTERKLQKKYQKGQPEVLIDHAQQIKSLTKKFERCQGRNNPFLKAKLRHLTKKEIYGSTKSNILDQTIQKVFQQSKLITLKQRRLRQNKKQHEAIKTYHESTLLY